MLESARIQQRQSEIRSQLADLSRKTEPSADETRSMDTLTGEYSANESRYRAALIVEDTERRETEGKLETRQETEWADLVGRFELRQAALHLDEGRTLEGATAEVVQELRARGGYRGIPVPLEALETRANETTAGDLVAPKQTAPIIDRLFPASVAAAMGTRMVNIGAGQAEYPITSQGVSTAWAATELAGASNSQYKTSERLVKPEHNLAARVHISRRSLMQAAGIEDAVRRDMRAAIQAALDKAVFLGTGAAGQPHGVIEKAAATYGINVNGVNLEPEYAELMGEVVEFIKANAATGPGDVRLLLRPEVWQDMDAVAWDTGSGITEWDRLTAKLGRVVMSSNALAAPAGAAPDVSKALLTTTAGGEAPIVLATWGAIDLIRDPYTEAASGSVLLTGIVTADVTAVRAAQLRVVSIKDIA